MNGLVAFIQHLLDVALAHRGWAGPAFGLLAFGESLAVAGAIIPATPALFLFGTLLGSGRLDPVEIVPYAIVGAIGGYWASWSIGRRIGPRLYHYPLIARHRRGVARARLFFRRWGGPSLVFGRYVLGPFQAMLPLVAGVAAMGARRFHAWNLLSSVLWVFVVLTPGFLVGRGISLPFVGNAFGGVLLGAVMAVSLGAVVVTVVGTIVQQVIRARRA